MRSIVIVLELLLLTSGLVRRLEKASLSKTKMKQKNGSGDDGNEGREEEKNERRMRQD